MQTANVDIVLKPRGCTSSDNVVMASRLYDRVCHASGFLETLRDTAIGPVFQAPGHFLGLFMVAVLVAGNTALQESLREPGHLHWFMRV
jgi:hypothetical protein